jgi:hypothetical protein
MPHIGTDVLRDVVKNIRKKIIKLGGEIRFESQVTGIEFDEKSSEITSDAREKRCELKSVTINGSERIECKNAVFALGNSARDTFRMMYAAGIHMEAKPFSVGVRIEHPQLMINESQYGAGANDSEGRLGAAAYKLSYHCKNGRGVYTFCMCPGGVVVGAASQEGGVVTNGMSYFARDGKNANSALLVGIEPDDYRYGTLSAKISDKAKTDDEIKSSENDKISLSSQPVSDGSVETVNPISGIEFQEELERRAFEAGGGRYFAPVEKLSDFLQKDKKSTAAKNETDEFNKDLAVTPTYRPGVTWTSIDDCLPDFITDAMREALPSMGKKLKGFDMGDAVITGVETRSSSPLKIPRDSDFESVSAKGIYPAGEGAGYAGGIMSAAVDGIRIAEAIISKMCITK